MNFSRDAIYQLETAIAQPKRYLLAAIFVVLFGLWHIATNTIILESIRWQNAIHFAGFALLACVTFPLIKSKSHQTVYFMVDVFFGIMLFTATLWIAYAENNVYANNVELSWKEWLASVIVVIGAIELCRRLTGWIIPILIIVALCYVSFLGQYLSGVFFFRGLPWEDILFRSMYNDEGMFGIIATISSSYIALFMIFGGFLIVSGASDFVIEVSKFVAGRFHGGSAFIAIISSALTGTISGSAIANTASTGIITIPMMKRNGFRAQFAAAVEASASTGSQMMPPIMGAGAFIMAANTQIPYATIVAVSTIPALLFFMSVAFVVRIEAMKHYVSIKSAIKTQDNSAVEVSRDKLIGGAINFLLPLGVMIGLLVSGITPNYAACVAIVVLIVASWFTKNKMTPKKIISAVQIGIKGAIITSVLLVSVGLIINVIATTGLGNTFSLMIVEWSQGSILIAFALIAIASLLLGMGLPVTAAYIILSILSAPVLAGMITDVSIVNLLQQGISDPSNLAMLSMIDSPFSEFLSSGLSADQAEQFVSQIPLEVASVIRSQLVAPELLISNLLIAHLVIFWLSQDSNITPPVCLVAFTAAGIAKSKPMATGIESWKVAKGLYIVPLLFIYTPLITGDWQTILWVGFFSLFGIYALNVIIQRYAETPIPIWSYPIYASASIATFYNELPLLNVLGAVVIMTLTWRLKRMHSQQ